MSNESGEKNNDSKKHFLDISASSDGFRKTNSHSTGSHSKSPEYYHENHKSSVLQYQLTSAQEYLRRVEATSKVEPNNTQYEVEILRLRNEIRKLKLRLAQRKRLATENESQREHRLATLRTNQRKRLANETPERREKRLQAMREYANKRIRHKNNGETIVTEPYIGV